MSIGALAHDETHSEVELVAVTITDQQASGVSFDAAALSNVDLSSSRLDALRLVDSTLDGCNLANLKARRAAAFRVSIQTSRMTGIVLDAADLRDVAIRDCRVDLASFSHSRLQRVTFEDCLLAQTDFLGSELESVRFHRCDLSRADFRGARMRRCEFRRNDLTELQGIGDLRGAAMEWADIVEMAGAWAHALGIEALEPDPE